MSNIRFRPAQHADVDQIRQCIAEAYADAIRELDDLPDVSAGIQDEIDTKRVVVAHAGEKIIGVVVFGSDGNMVMISNLAVSPLARGQGLARKLLGFAEDEALRRKCRGMGLRTHRLLDAARKMYRHLGWVETDLQGNVVILFKELD